MITSRNHGKRPFNPYNSVDRLETYEDSYITMAPSDARPKAIWSVQRRRRSMGGVHTASGDEAEEAFNPYDEIPGDRHENLYDEIRPRTRVISTITHEDLGGLQHTIGERSWLILLNVRHILLKMGRYCSTTMCHYWDMSVK